MQMAYEFLVCLAIFNVNYLAATVTFQTRKCDSCRRDIVPDKDVIGRDTRDTPLVRDVHV